MPGRTERKSGHACHIKTGSGPSPPTPTPPTPSPPSPTPRPPSPTPSSKYITEFSGYAECNGSCAIAVGCRAGYELAEGGFEVYQRINGSYREPGAEAALAFHITKLRPLDERAYLVRGYKGNTPYPLYLRATARCRKTT